MQILEMKYLLLEAELLQQKNSWTPKDLMGPILPDFILLQCWDNSCKNRKECVASKVLSRMDDSCYARNMLATMDIWRAVQTVE